jgi:hypothetical protein
MDDHQTVQTRPERRRRARNGIFWPLLLIAIGIAFLLSNLGLIESDIWSMIINLWPLLLIAGGLDGLIKREGLVGSALVIALGIIFLLSNFGYFALNPLEIIFRFWPIFLIAAGFDLIIGRRSLIGGLIGVVIIVALLVGALLIYGIRPGGLAVTGEQISQGLEGAAEATVILESGVGALRVEAMPQPDGLLQGRVDTGRGHDIRQNFRMEGDRAVYELRQTGVQIAFPGGSTRQAWELQVNPDVPLDLEVDLGVGEARLNLSGVALNSLDVDLGVGEVELTLPDEGQYSARVDGAIGSLKVFVPEGLGVRLERDTGLGGSNLPSGYNCDGDTCTSPNYDSAEHRADLHLSQAIGAITVRPAR